MCVCVCVVRRERGREDTWKTCACVRALVLQNEGCPLLLLLLPLFQLLAPCFCGSRCGVPALRPASRHRPRLLPVPARPGLLWCHTPLRPRGHSGVCRGEQQGWRLKVTHRVCRWSERVTCTTCRKHPQVPLMEVAGPLAVVQLLETSLLCLVNYSR